MLIVKVTIYGENLRKHYGSQSFTGKVPVHGISKLQFQKAALVTAIPLLVTVHGMRSRHCHFHEIWKVVHCLRGLAMGCDFGHKTMFMG